MLIYIAYLMVLLMNEFEKMNNLLDFYETLLTTKQLEIMNYYYRENYSLNEIAEILAVSKAAVADSLKRSQKIIIELEKKLQLYHKFKKRQEIYETLKQFSEHQELIYKLEEID